MEADKYIKKIKTISFIGAGNVATHLSAALNSTGYKIIGVHTRSRESSKLFSHRYGCYVADTLSELPESDAYIFCIKDDALHCVIHEFGKLYRQGLCIHTSGSIPMEIFSGNVNHYGVLYPLQTFSKNRKIVFSEIPLFIEAKTTADFDCILEIAYSLSNLVYPLSTDLRRQLHLAAVFANNFSNHCFAIASSLLSEINLSEKLLLPLIRETCSKLQDLPAVEGQTGPAVRYDQEVINNQLVMLKNDDLRKNIYKLMSESIHDYAIHSTNDISKDR